MLSKREILTTVLVSGILLGCNEQNKNKSSAQIKQQQFQNISSLFKELSKKDETVLGSSITLQCGKDQKAETINYGVLKKDGDNVTDNSIFEIGSNSKSFLSVVFLKLETEGKLKLEDTVGMYLKEEYPKWNHITIKQLLNMTSGIKDNNKIYDKLIENPLHKFNSDQQLEFVEEYKAENNFKYNYSNSNYALLSKILEKVTHNSVKHEITERIIKKLKLKRTFYIEHLVKEEISQDLFKDYSYGYIIENGYELVNNGSNVSMSFAAGAGSIISTTQELNTYIQALYAGSLLTELERKKLLTLVNMNNGEALHNGVNSAQEKGYGLGIAAKYNKKLNETIYLHNGSTSGQISFTRYFNKKTASYTLILNSDLKDPKNLVEKFDKLTEEISHYCKKN